MKKGTFQNITIVVGLAAGFTFGPLAGVGAAFVVYCLIGCMIHLY